MAKKSKIAKNEQRKAIVARYAEKRLELRKYNPFLRRHTLHREVK